MTEAERRTIRLAESDNVVVARVPIEPGQGLDPEEVAAATPVPAGHKVATAAIAVGEPVRKFGQVIGFATDAIPPGAHVHSHNLAIGKVNHDHEFGADCRETEMVPEAERATFQGIVRPDGRVGTRNYILVLATVNCSATVVQRIADEFRGNALADYPHVDGVFALSQSTGCGVLASPDTFDMIQRCTYGYAMNPNVAGVLLVGLGCESNQIPALAERFGFSFGPMVVGMTIQDSGGTIKTVREGIARVREMLPEANKAVRRAVPASHLMLGLQCGGSDGYSGITANPALGAAVDLLVSHGGTAILGETSEVYGAEHLLTRRAVERRVGQRLLERLAWWEDYAANSGGHLDNNPSPGNKAGGLTTILEKSLGAIAKGGTTDLVGYYDYAEPVTKKGFVFMDTPGYDPMSITGMVAAGANIVSFTTGRGSVFGCKPAPSLKLASNTPMYDRMADDMDVNCGLIADGASTVPEMGGHIFELLLEVASGRKTKSEELGFGDEEFVPWQHGAIM